MKTIDRLRKLCNRPLELSTSYGLKIRTINSHQSLNSLINEILATINLTSGVGSFVRLSGARFGVESIKEAQRQSNIELFNNRNK